MTSLILNIKHYNNKQQKFIELFSSPLLKLAATYYWSDLWHQQRFQNFVDAKMTNWHILTLHVFFIQYKMLEKVLIKLCIASDSHTDEFPSPLFFVTYLE